MHVFALVFLAASTFGQQSPEDAINSIFSTNGNLTGFLENYEEVTPAPLKSIGALTRCGEEDQQNLFVCVPYYNCDPDTNTVQENPDIDGTNKIDIRMGEDDRKCDHYLEICCKASNAQATNAGTTGRPTTVTRLPTSAPVTEEDPVTPKVVNCGIRNANGLDFNLIGGTNEANFGEFPWMVEILWKSPRPNQPQAICGGSVISPGVILTGAHCVKDVNIDDIKIRAGEWDTQTQNERIPYQERNVTRTIIHGHYTKGNLYNDVALLVLDRQLAKTDSVGTICLPNQNEFIDSRDCFATGWGKNTFGKQGVYAVILKKIQLPVVQHDPCQAALKKTRLGPSFLLHRSFICAGGEAGLDTCTGDGGSPLVCPDPKNPNRYVQVGIVAWGIGCGENGVPGVYVDVAQFRNWVDTRMQELGININSYVL